jgi:hypothetical protein
VTVGPAPVLALLVGLFHTSLYVLIRGSTDGRLPLLLVAACLGAWAGDALGARLGWDFLRIGDFRTLPASIVAWLGIATVTIVAILGTSRVKEEE